MLEATRREANELYTFFTLLSQGGIAYADSEGNPSGMLVPVVAIHRKEHDGMRKYLVQGSDIRVVGEDMTETFPREDFGAAADILFRALQAEGKNVDISDIEPFLDALKIFDMEAQTDDRTDMHLQLWSADHDLLGVRIQSRLCGFVPLLDGGRTANIKFEQTGVRFSQPAVHKINWTEDEDNVAEVARRILYIESLGGILKYSDVADRIFRSNLLMIDTNLPRVLATMLRTLHLDGVSRVDELLPIVDEKNPLKVKDELVRKHGFYAHKLREFLLACAWGMRPAKMYNGRESAVTGYIFVNKEGQLVLFDKAHEQTFADYLLTHTRLEKVLPDEAKYGYLERENGAYYLKLNLRVGFVRK